MAYPYGPSPLMPYPAPRRRSRVGWWIGGIAFLVVIVVAVAAVALAVSWTSDSGESTISSGNELTAPTQVAVDDAGSVYVRDSHDHRILRIDGESADQVELSFGDGVNIFEMAVSPGGDVYVVDRAERVLKLTAGQPDPEEVSLPTGTVLVDSIAVDADGNLWMVDGTRFELLRLDAGASDWTTVTEVPADVSVSGLVAVGAEDVYAWMYYADSGERTIAHWTGGRWEVLPDSGINGTSGLAVDADGTLYVADARVDLALELTEGSTRWEVLDFETLASPTGIAVGSDGAVLVADTGNNRIVRLGRS